MGKINENIKKNDIPKIIFLLIMATANLIHFDIQLKVELKRLIFIPNLTKFKDSK